MSDEQQAGLPPVVTGAEQADAAPAETGAEGVISMNAVQAAVSRQPWAEGGAAQEAEVHSDESGELADSPNKVGLSPDLADAVEKAKYPDIDDKVGLSPDLAAALDAAKTEPSFQTESRQYGNADSPATALPEVPKWDAPTTHTTEVTTTVTMPHVPETMTPSTMPTKTESSPQPNTTITNHTHTMPTNGY
ncbi:MAG: hypothetical protein JWO47_1085 [Candidatus Saccharibacteria bacterium]|nr:hypothetical protein [Candidatus Saccharibacteria bacterium]